MLSNSQAFARAAEAVRQIVDDCGGVCVIDREELWRDVLLSEPSLQRCAPSVKDHLALSLRRVRIASRSFGDEPEVLMLYDTSKYDERGARYAWENDSAEADSLVFA